MNRHVVSVFVIALFAILAAGSIDDKRSSDRTDRDPSPQLNSGRPPDQDVRITAAALFSSRYASSPWSGLHIQAQAAGADCGVLLIRIPAVMDEASIDAMQAGNAYAAYAGGVEHFYHERTFRGVVYQDGNGPRARYGLVSSGEVKELTPCAS